MTNKDEQYYRVDEITANLLKQAGFDLDVTAGYDIEVGSHTYQEGLRTLNYNVLPRCSSAPLIDIALVWCKELGYEFETTADIVPIYLRKGIELQKIVTVPVLSNKRDTNMLFIKACCEHQIKLKNQ